MNVFKNPFEFFDSGNQCHVQIITANFFLVHLTLFHFLGL